MADPTIIAAETAVAGRIHGAEGDVSVEGFVDGTIELSQTLQIAPNGRVQGEVRARQVVIEGAFQGDIVAEERVVLAATARAVATIEAPLVEMEDGARLRGELNVGVDGEVSIPPDRRTTRQRSPATAATPPPASTSRQGTSSTASGGAAARTATSSATATTVVEEVADEEEEEPEPTHNGKEFPSEAAIEQYREEYTVKELRSELRDRDLRVSGTKDELIERLLTADAEDG